MGHTMLAIGIGLALGLLLGGRPRFLGEHHFRLWPLVIADHQNYAGYQTKTDREIPLVLLEPVTS